MKSILYKIPLLLVLSRILTGLIIILISIFTIDNYRLIIVCLTIFGFLTDFFDGYLARLIGISNERLRRLDTLVDRIFWLSILFAAWVSSGDFLISRKYWILLVLGMEALNYLISFIRFGKEIATHAILSKIWAVTLLFGFCDLILNQSSSYLFDISIFAGIISRIDTALIMLILPKWTHDIPSFYHSILIRKGIEIKRYRLFNSLSH